MQKGKSLASKLWIWQPFEIWTDGLKIVCDEIYKAKKNASASSEGRQIRTEALRAFNSFLNDRNY